MTRRLKHVDLCSLCVLDGGWDYSEPDNPKRCDHGALAQAVAVAERADREPLCTSCEGEGYGPCRCSA